MRGILLFLGLTLCSAAVGADRQPDFYCRQVSIESGLSQSSVTSLLRDRRGLLWIGTRSGLNLFDRDDLTNYFHDRDDARSIPGNYIYHLSEDCRGRIWVRVWVWFWIRVWFWINIWLLSRSQLFPMHSPRTVFNLNLVIRVRLIRIDLQGATIGLYL